ncbi:MAG: hypothetical protein M3O78_04465 [Chloroflexota bacterium]|nr:hypothetical protein [Chloroflexota bacterium]
MVDVRRPDRAARITLAAGLLLMVVVQLPAHHVATALYDGVVTEDPYRYLQPHNGALGNPTSATVTAAVSGGAVGQLFAATDEVPPQAQVIAEQGALVLPDGAKTVTMSIRPVAPASLPSTGRLSGNVYRILVTDQSGAPVTIRPASLVTLVLRGDRPPTNGTIAQYVAGSWETVPSDIGGLPDLFSSNITSFGDFAVIDSAALQSPSAVASAAPSATPTPTDQGGPPWILIILIAVGAAAVGWVWGDAWDANRH